MPSSQVTPESINVYEFLNQSYLIIPPNQREYRWTNNERDQLWNDLELLYDNFEGNSKQLGSGHFLGGVFTIGSASCSEADPWKVIDGQQRLTTLTILVACMRYFMDKVTSRNLLREFNNFTDIIFEPSKDMNPRIILNRENEFYSRSIRCESYDSLKSTWNEIYTEKSEVQRNIKDAFEFFYEKINDFLTQFGSEEELEDGISDFLACIVKGFYILHVRTANEELTYKLFETLNGRGLELSKADLIKNVLLDSAKKDVLIDESEVSELWSDFVDLYEDQSMSKLKIDQIIQFSLSSRYQLVKKDSIYEEVEALLKGTVSSDSIVSDLIEDAKNWNYFLKGDVSIWDDDMIESQNSILGPLWKDHAAPLIMAVMKCYSEDLSSLKISFNAIECYLFRQGLICRESVSVLQEHFSKAAILVRNGAPIERLLQVLGEWSPSAIFLEYFKVFSVKNMNQAFYILWKIEHSQNSDVLFRPSNERASQHVEHILPKKPGEGWDITNKTDGFNNYINRIGNLLILESEINSFIKNKEIHFKMENEQSKSYKSSALVLPSEFVENFSDWSDVGSWSFKGIVSRQDHIANTYAESIWRL